MAAAKKKPFLYFQGRPLVRSGNILFYGNLTDKCVIMMQILDTKKDKDIDLSTKISVELHSNDPDIKGSERIIQRTEKTGMYSAITIATIWLNRALEE